MSSKLDKVADLADRARSVHFRVGDLAKQCDVTRRQLGRYLRLRFGCPPRDWIRNLRLEDALTLLSTGKSVKEAAEATGFSDAAQFSRAFKRVYHMNPRALHRPDN